MPKDGRGGGSTLDVPQYSFPPQIVTENGDTFHQELEVFLWSGEGLRMPEEELNGGGGPSKCSSPLFLPRGDGEPKAGLEGAGGRGRREERGGGQGWEGQPSRGSKEESRWKQ